MSLVSCTSCGALNSPGQKFCGECGISLPRACPTCGAPLTLTQKFCGECGAPIHSAVRLHPPASMAHASTNAVSSPPPAMEPSRSASTRPEEERRLVTVLFCDLVGFTPLSESLDPEDVRDIQAEYFSAMSGQIERYGGTVEKYAGDAVLALFGAPIAHEDDAERAVLCALGMQAAIAPVADHARQGGNVEPSIRVGVNTGDVVSGTWNASGRQDVAVTGDAVNTAARIQSTAEPGEVLVGTETMRLTRRRIRYGERRDVVLKGKIGTVPVYPALGLRDRFGERWETDEGATPLIGRDREMVALLDAWVRAQGGEGQLVTLIGDAGVGKSRLVSELVDKVTAGAAIRVVRARCLSYGQGISLWLIADLVRSVCGIGEQDALAEVQATMTVVLPALLTRCPADSQAEALDVLGEVLGLPAGDSIVAHAGAEIRQQALIRSLKLVLAALSERAPTVLVLEDVHWVDEASQNVLKEVLSDVPGLRLLVLVAHRPGWTAPWSEWGWTERTTLRPLRDADAALLAGAVLGGVALSPALEGYVAERAGGNPFFVEEMLRALEESEGLVHQDGAMALAPGVAERLPSTLTEVLLARLDRLDGEVRGVAQVASVIGRSFAVRLLAQVMERGAEALEPPLAALQQAEIAFPRRGSDVEYVFKHVTMREAAYNTLVQKRRQQLHLDTARAIASLYPNDEYVEIIAYHYGKTAEHGEAAQWLERAGDRAAGIYANETAISNFQEASRRCTLAGGESTTLARLDEKLGEVLYTAGRYDEALVPLERAVVVYRETRDLEGAGRAAALLGHVHHYRGTSQIGLDAVEPMIELLAWSGPSAALAALHLALARLLLQLGRYEDILAAAERASEIAAAIGHDRFLASAEESRGTALTFLGQPEPAREALERAIPLLEQAGDLRGLTVALTDLGEAHRLAGELRDALRYTEQAQRVAERVGDPSTIAFALMNLGQIRLSLGEWTEARDDLERAQEVLAPLTSASAWAAYLPSLLGQLLLCSGDWEGAETQLERSLGMAEVTRDRQLLESTNVAWAELEILRGESEAAINRLEPLAGGEGAFLVLIEATLAWAYHEQGDAERAAELSIQAVGRARKTGEILALVDALRVLGMVFTKQGQLEEAGTVFHEGLALARSLPYPYAEARILVEMGALDDALTIFQRLGAAKEVERVEHSLVQVVAPNPMLQSQSKQESI